jgi:hypothetical protein
MIPEDHSQRHRDHQRYRRGNNPHPKYLPEMEIPLEVASRIAAFICKADDEYRKKLIVESNSSNPKKKNETIWEDLYG